MIVVSDTSSLCNLALVNHLNLLAQLYQMVIIPPVVADELAIAPDSRITHILSQQWIQKKSLHDSSLAEQLQRTQGLDPGESYAIACPSIVAHRVGDSTPILPHAPISETGFLA